MDPIGERVLCFVLGLAVGAIAGWLLGVRRRRRVESMRAEIHPATPQPSPAPAEELPEFHPHVPAVARLIDVGAARAAGFNLKHAEDLTIIEGVGPKTEELLRANGIAGFAQLAEADKQALRVILDEGGPNFRYANPTHWAQQAALVVQNDWIALKQLQRELNGIG